MAFKAKVHFNSLNELIEFEKNLEWHKESEITLSNFRAGSDVRAKYDHLKGIKYFGIIGDQIVSVVSGEFKEISVSEIAEACEKEFGSNYLEKGFKEGIVRVYDKGIEDRTGKVTPLVVFPANLGNMAVKIGIYHNAHVCSNGMIIADNLLTERIVHRLSIDDLSSRVRRVSGNLGQVLNSVTNAHELTLQPGVQLAMIVQGLNKTDNLVSKAVSKYLLQDNTLWNTIQAITYVATHETRNGYSFSKNAGDYLLRPEVGPCDIVDAASYVFAKQNKGIIDFPGSAELFSMAREVLA